MKECGCSTIHRSSSSRTKYQFEPTPQWLEHLQKSSVRFNSGGSGSFVSANGLVHHESSRRAPIPCRNLRARKTITCATAFTRRRSGGTKARRPRAERLDVDRGRDRAGERGAYRRDVAGRMQLRRARTRSRRSRRRAKKRPACDPMWSRFTRAAFINLYRYKRYDDVRLVFAPEQQIAFYGGDPDNFEYPRYDLDICIFRAYENGQPAKIEHFLKWNSKGPSRRRTDLRQRTSGPNRSAADH